MSTPETQRPLAAADYARIVEEHYFGNMARNRPGEILALLTEDAVLTGLFGTDRARIVRHRPGPGEEAFAHFMGALQPHYELSYSEFFHVSDPARERHACTFRLDIVPKPHRAELGPRIMRNANLFQFRGARICAVTAYFARPASDVQPWPFLQPAPGRHRTGNPSP